MCRTREEIKNNDVLVSEVDDYLLERLSDGNGDKHWDILLAKMLQNTYINSEYNEGQIKDLADSVDSLTSQVTRYIDETEKCRKENPTLGEKLKTQTAAVIATIMLVYGALFLFYYTVVTIVGYAELLQVFVP
jgi:hypothetical protein